MITVKEFPNKSFADRGEVFKALRDNKAFLINQKKSIIKNADSVLHHPMVLTEGFGKAATVKALKEEGFDPETITKMEMDLAINTTNILDSHSDVHLPGLWDKSLKETKILYLLQEHKMVFDKIITDDVKASAEMMAWKELGYDFDGQTQVLRFKANAEKERNPYMFGQYAKGFVKNHSVGMRYIKLFLAMDSEAKWDVEEKEIWDRYIDQIVNRKAAEAQGYFWAVTEAKVVEGSAVPLGSNWATPTISVSGKQGAAESTPDTDKGAGEGHSEEEGNKPNNSDFFKNLL